MSRIYFCGISDISDVGCDLPPRSLTVLGLPFDRARLGHTQLLGQHDVSESFMRAPLWRSPPAKATLYQLYAEM